MLRIDKLTYRIGPRVLLDQAEASVNTGHRVGLVGRNGTGKTTLLRLITGALEADAGRIHVPKGWRVGITTQEAPGGSLSLLETVLAADTELAALEAEAETSDDGHRIAEIHERLRDKAAHTAPARAARILAGLGFSEDEQRRPCNEFSGGWRMRVALAALLFTEPDLLLLDEPTNHLDLEASLWLEDFLRRYPGTVLLVSHDRDLLNRVVGEIINLEHGKLTHYQGGYDKFEATQRMHLALNEKARAKQEAQRAHIQSFIKRFRYKATKAKQAQSRIKMLARMEPLPERHGEQSVTFAFPEPDALASPLFSADDVAVGYDGRAVLRGMNLRLDHDDRIALLGANGNGKSTLIKLLAGRLAPLKGEVTKSRKLRVGYFAQHQAEELDLRVTPIVEIARKRPKDTETQHRGLLGRFGLTQERAETKNEHLSGGEKARLLFALMSCDKPHILLLDEPTNHLDVLSRQALVQAINAFAGAVVLVSHDPYILETTADRFWQIEGGRVRPFDGDMEDYRALLLRRNSIRGGGEAGSGPWAEELPETQQIPEVLDKKEQRRIAAEKRKAVAPLKKRLVETEAAIHKLGKEKTELEAEMADPALYNGDGAKLVALQKRLGQVAKDLETAEEAWLHLREDWEQAQSAS